MNQGPNRQSTLWNTVSQLSCQFDAKAVHQWLQTNLPFWPENKPFDHMGFVAWYDRANFMDKEIVFKNLTMAEQNQVLKAWANVMPTTRLTVQYQRSITAIAETDSYLDNTPPLRVRGLKHF